MTGKGLQIHIFSSENLYTQKYLEVLERNFDISSSLFIYKKSLYKKFEYSENLNGRILRINNNLKFFYRLLPELRRSSSIILHQFPSGPALLFWNIFRGLFSKITWIIWGGDLYKYMEAETSLSARFYEVLRKRIIKHISFIASFVPGDYKIAKEVYKSKATWFQIIYPLPVDFIGYSNTRSEVCTTDVLKILCGNSGNPSNNHTEILTMLEPLKNTNIRIYCPLSYSGDNDYIKRIQALGKTLFGEKFIPMLEILESPQYLDLLFDIDLAFMNHKRQQGLGNILPLLYFGKKVYMHSDISTYIYLKSLGCNLYDIASFHASFKDLVKTDNDKLNINKEIIGNLLSEKAFVKFWNQIIN
jgi:hypothetical protein